MVTSAFFGFFKKALLATLLAITAIPTQFLCSNECEMAWFNFESFDLFTIVEVIENNEGFPILFTDYMATSPIRKGFCQKNSFLIKRENTLILFDVGENVNWHLKFMESGVKPSDIDVVFFTQLKNENLKNLVNADGAIFSGASLYISRFDREEFEQSGAADRSEWNELTNAYGEQKIIYFSPLTNTELMPGIKVLPFFWKSNMQSVYSIDDIILVSGEYSYSFIAQSKDINPNSGNEMEKSFNALFREHSAIMNAADGVYAGRNLPFNGLMIIIQSSGVRPYPLFLDGRDERFSRNHDEHDIYHYYAGQVEEYYKLLSKLFNPGDAKLLNGIEPSPETGVKNKHDE